MATQTVNARFANGVLTPLEPLDLPEGVLVELSIQPLDAPALDAAVQIAAKTEFRVVPNRGGFVPGIDPDNLKDIIHDQEDEEFVEKLAP